MPPAKKEPKKMTDQSLVAAAVRDPGDEELLAELKRRTDRLPVTAAGAVDVDVAAQFIAYTGRLRANGMVYQKGEYLERRLVPVWEALKPKAPQVVMEPYAREVVLGEDGRDPDTGTVYPVGDADAMLRHAWLAERLPVMSASFRCSDADLVAETVARLGGDPEKYTPNMKKALRAYEAASPEERAAVAWRLKPGPRPVGAALTAPPAAPPPAAAPSYQAPPAAPSPVVAQTPAPVAQGDRKVLVIYSQADAKFFEQLRRAATMPMRQNRYQIVSFHEVPPGSLTSVHQEAMIREADVVVLLVSGDFYADLGWTVDEMNRRSAGRPLIAVKVRAVAWDPILANRVTLPRSGSPVASYADRDSAWVEIVDEVTRAVTR